MRPKGPVIVALAVLTAFVALLVYGVASQGVDSTIDSALAQGEAPPAAPLSLDLLEDAGEAEVARAAADGKVTLEELEGQPIVLNFWASWCDPCAVETPDLVEAAEANPDVLFLGVNVQDIRGDAREFIEEFGMNYPSVRDGSKETMRDWGVSGLPETYFLTEDGRVAAHVVGVVSPEQLEQGIAAAEAGQPLGAERGGESRSVE